MCANWILQENIKPLLGTISRFVGAELNNWDWDAITLGLKNTDHEHGQWFDYQFQARDSVKVRLALERGTELLFVELESNPRIELQCEVALSIMQDYRLKP